MHARTRTPARLWAPRKPLRSISPSLPHRGLKNPRLTCRRTRTRACTRTRARDHGHHPHPNRHALDTETEKPAFLSSGSSNCPLLHPQGGHETAPAPSSTTIADIARKAFAPQPPRKLGRQSRRVAVHRPPSGTLTAGHGRGARRLPSEFDPPHFSLPSTPRSLPAP
jgi:hypothetical protein